MPASPARSPPSNGPSPCTATTLAIRSKCCGGWAGAILAARSEKIPVVLDGYVVCAAAAIIHAMDPSLLDHCIAGHVSAEGAHGEVLRRLGKKPLLDLGMRLGEGSGAALAVGVIKAALACHTGMATFGQAGVSDKT